MRPLDVTSAQLMSESRAVVALLQPHALAERLGRVKVVDIRDLIDRQREGHIGGSFHVPRTVLEWRVDADAELPNSALVDPDSELVIVCNDGYSSLLAAATLHRMGFRDVGHLERGHRGWIADGFEVVFDDPKTDHLAEPGTAPRR